MVIWWLITCKEVVKCTFICLFVLFRPFGSTVDCTKHVYTFLKCINRTLSLLILPVSFQSSDWKQLSSTFFFLYSWFKYLMKLIITILFFFYSLLALDKHGERISVSCLTFKYFGRWFNLKSSPNFFITNQFPIFNFK